MNELKNYQKQKEHFYENSSTTKTLYQLGFRCGQQSLLPIAIADCTRDNWQMDIVVKIKNHIKEEAE